MTPLTILDRIQIAAPCPASWEGMAGNDRARFCASCEKHVYNIAEMTTDEALLLLRDADGHACVQIYRRQDGTVLTADCPVGLRARAARRLRRLASGLAASVAVVLTGAFLRANDGEACTRTPASVPWYDRLLESFGLRMPLIPFVPTVTRGEAAALPPPIAPKAPVPRALLGRPVMPRTPGPAIQTPVGSPIDGPIGRPE